MWRGLDEGKGGRRRLDGWCWSMDIVLLTYGPEIAHFSHF